MAGSLAMASRGRAVESDSSGKCQWCRPPTSQLRAPLKKVEGRSTSAMSGRGVRFTAVYAPPGGTQQVFEIECARHSPLSIVKEQLMQKEQLMGNSVDDMSLVLQDTSDKEDGTLLEGDYERVQSLGIMTGSTIWVSFLSAGAAGTPKRSRKPPSSPPISPVILPAAESPRDSAADDGAADDGDELARAEQRARDEVRSWLDAEQEERTDTKRKAEMRQWAQMVESGCQPNPEAPSPVSERTVSRDVSLDTPVQPRQADHSYNGVVFDITAHGSHELRIKSLWLGGMLGTVRCFAMKEGPWHKGQFASKIRRCGWNNMNDVLDRQDWDQVGCQRLAAAWDGTRELPLDKPVRIAPGETRGFYVHSGLPDDLGLQYQSYGEEDDIVAADEHLTIHPGVGHTGSHAFENYHGWYRAIRGPSGTVSYTATLRTWTAPTHKIFPAMLRSAVVTMLLCQQRKDTVLSLLPRDIILAVLECCDCSWFDGAGAVSSDESEEEDDDDVAPTIEEVLQLLPEHRRTSIERSLAAMGELQQLRALERLWERYDGAEHRREQRARAQRLEQVAVDQRAWAVFGDGSSGSDDDDSDDFSDDEGDGVDAVMMAMRERDFDDSDDHEVDDDVHVEPQWVRQYYVARTSSDVTAQAISTTRYNSWGDLSDILLRFQEDSASSVGEATGGGYEDASSSPVLSAVASPFVPGVPGVGLFVRPAASQQHRHGGADSSATVADASLVVEDYRPEDEVPDREVARREQRGRERARAMDVIRSNVQRRQRDRVRGHAQQPEERELAEAEHELGFELEPEPEPEPEPEQQPEQQPALGHAVKSFLSTFPSLV